MSEIYKPIDGTYRYDEAIDAIAMDKGWTKKRKDKLSNEFIQAIIDGKLLTNDPDTGAPLTVKTASMYVTAANVKRWFEAEGRELDWTPRSTTMLPDMTEVGGTQESSCGMPKLGTAETTVSGQNTASQTDEIVISRQDASDDTGDVRTNADTDHDPDETLAALFDPVPVESLEKMFPAFGKWKDWAERAARNGLIGAREKRAMFNPYRAAKWFHIRGNDGWDISRCNRALANNLPPRSLDQRHLLTGELD